MDYDNGVKITVRHMLQLWGLILVMVSFISSIAITIESSIDAGIIFAVVAILLVQMLEAFVLTILVGNT